ncbi:MAG TPA: CDP-diacylglycerol--serine O-phosphatidyltransferase [Stellaceae bacterium]
MFGSRRALHQRRLRVRRISGLSPNRMIPNVLTLLALCAGMTAIRLAITGKYESAVIAIIVAGILDGLDGRIARLLKSTSSFGAQLDSLADFIDFGVAPAIVVYLWATATLGSLGWAVAVFYAICCALRLARFNTQLDVELPSYAYNFFSGVPAPAGAALVILPMFMSFEWGDTVFRSATLNTIVLAAVGALMASRVPTLSLKRVRIRPDQILPVLIGIAIAVALLSSAPWPTLTLVGLAYLGSIPLTVRNYYRLKQAHEAAGGGAAGSPASQPVPATPTAADDAAPRRPRIV